MYADEFTAPIDTANWVAEVASEGQSRVFSGNGKLILDTRGGVTVWFKQPLAGNYRIEYDRTVVMAGGENDRISDLNQFWLASDPRHPSLFTRGGVFEEYDSLRLLYVGMGGNYNSTTRFRYYDGTGRKTLLASRNDSAHLLRANVTYHIAIEVRKGKTSFWVDGERVFYLRDKRIAGPGYFGFRSTWSRQEISGFKVYRL
ncbi:DUF6250 domain-containing protein [Chitinophaga sedimenti]|uniref:DUF6250 domain-containing protein n=1 Tax=Chitinophaga sedimenti TaxID=2033606 RepID=UPI002005A160|nr:DUF6250 domain-containing protein [Chitinophaga sedimenti]MCK7559820.1 DUF6250 domain-containing protein [Chitinophaga sedimenti]